MAKAVRLGTFWAMALWGLLGILFVAGYAYDDPGGAAATGATALWVVPMLALSAFALWRPDMATPVVVGVTAAAMLFTLADSIFGIVPRDEWGPVSLVVVFATGITLGALGLHKPGISGALLMGLSLVQMTAWGLGAIFGPEVDAVEGSLLAVSTTGVVVAPLLFFGALFLLAGALQHDEPQLAAPAH